MKSFDVKRYRKVIQKQSKPAVMVKRKETEQVHISIGVRTVPVKHKDKYALSILASILGGGMSSRLFHEVREKRGFAYYVRTSSDHYQDSGTLVSTAGVDPKKVDEAISVIVEQYFRLTSAGSANSITNKELKKAKEFIKGHLVLEIEDSRAVAGLYGLAEMLENKIETPSEYM